MNAPSLCFGLALALTNALPHARAAAPTNSTVLFATGFELNEGYDSRFTLAGQNGWVSFGSGGNMLVTNFFEGGGQQALIGYHPPEAPKYDQLNLLWPVNLRPVDPAQSLVRFSVLMEVVDSANNQWDYFRWSAYNVDGHRLFSLDFDNFTAEITFALNGTNGFVSTGFRFDNGQLYELTIDMNFARNLWSANMNGLTIVDVQPITVTDVPLDLGSVDAVWVIRRAGSAGDNYMLFDDYRITAESLPSIPPSLEVLAAAQPGTFDFRLHGEPGMEYVIDYSEDLRSWLPASTHRLPASGTLDLTDSAAGNTALRFYRARQAANSPFGPAAPF
jgi:hypothetical protein